MRVLAAMAFLVACGPKPTPAPIPVLPGDGDSHVAKPPAITKPAIPDPWAGKTDLIAAPAPKAATPVELPAIESYKLANGLQVHVVKSDRLPVVSMQVAVRAGRMHEPQARLGVAEIAGDMLVKGTKRRDALALAKTIDFVGGTISADATFEATLLSCSVLARNAGTCLELLPEMLTQPVFPDAELQKVREQAIGAIRQRYEDPGQLAAAHVQNLLWGETHVRGWITNEQSVMSIRREDLVAWHKAWFVPLNSMLVVTGDVDPKKLRADLERTFGTWARGPVPPAPSYKEQGLSGSRIKLVDKPGQAQTHIRIAQFGIKHEDPRFFDTLVWNYVLGGSGQSSRLFKAVRGDGARSFGATSSFDRNLDKGSFVASTVSQSRDAVATAKVLLAEIARMAKDGPKDDEVGAAVANISGGYGLRFQAVADIGAALIGAELHGFGREYLQNFPVAVGKVDAASAKKAASEILDPKAYVIVLVGDAKDLEPQLKAAGWKYQKVAFTDPVNAPPPEAPIDPKQAAAAKQLVDEALNAKGGRTKLAALKGFKMVANGTTTIQGKTVPVTIERVFLLPDKMRIDADLAQKVKVVVAVDGKRGWQLAPDQTGTKMQLDDIGPADIASIDFERWREPELILLKASDPNARITTLPDEAMTKHVDPALDGKLHSIVKLRSPMGIDILLYFNKQTKLLSRLSYTEGPVSETDDFSDYKDIKGIKVAHKRHSAGGPRTTRLDLKSVEFDPTVDPKLFVKPPPPAAPAPAPVPPKQ